MGVAIIHSIIEKMAHNIHKTNRQPDDKSWLMVNAVEVVDGIYNISTLGHSSNLWEEYIQRQFLIRPVRRKYSKDMFCN